MHLVTETPNWRLFMMCIYQTPTFASLILANQLSASALPG